MWRQILEVQLKYFDFAKPEGMKAHGGGKILSIDKNAAEPEGDLGEYKKLIAKIEHVYVSTNTRIHARFRFNKIVRQPGQSIVQY